jgi:hypothetical protein
MLYLHYFKNYITNLAFVNSFSPDHMNYFPQLSLRVLCFNLLSYAPALNLMIHFHVLKSIHSIVYRSVCHVILRDAPLLSAILFSFSFFVWLIQILTKRWDIHEHH